MSLKVDQDKYILACPQLSDAGVVYRTKRSVRQTDVTRSSTGRMLCTQETGDAYIHR